MAGKESYAGKINRKLNKKLHVIDVAAGRALADLVLKNATYVNVFSNELCHGDIAVAEGLIVGMGEYSGYVEVDVSDKIVLPGFIDAHIHLESSLVSPKEFAKAVLPHGTTTVITDPHEIANVMGTDGIDYMLAATEDLPMDTMFMIPSCVPASPLDESGAELDYNAFALICEELEKATATSYTSVYEGDGAYGNDIIFKAVFRFNSGKVPEASLEISRYSEKYCKVSFMGREDQLITLEKAEKMASLLSDYFAQ